MVCRPFYRGKMRFAPLWDVFYPSKAVHAPPGHIFYPGKEDIAHGKPPDDMDGIYLRANQLPVVCRRQPSPGAKPKN